MQVRKAKGEKKNPQTLLQINYKILFIERIFSTFHLSAQTKTGEQVLFAMVSDVGIVHVEVP